MVGVWGKNLGEFWCIMCIVRKLGQGYMGHTQPKIKHHEPPETVKLVLSTYERPLYKLHCELQKCTSVYLHPPKIP